MKTHQKLTFTLIIVIAALLYIVNKNNGQLKGKADSLSMLKETFSDVTNASEIDSTALKKLLPFFKVKKDEFDPNGRLKYVCKDSPEAPKGSAMYCYFEQINNTVADLRFRMQFENKEWLFIRKCQFLIDNIVYEYYPSDFEFNAGNPGRVCEWFDDSINESNAGLIKALSKAKEAKVKVIGRHYHTVIVISPQQIESINNTLTLYSAMGGDISI